MIRAIAAYIRTFTGFGRDARRFLLTTVIFGVASSLYWFDFNLYVESLGLDLSTVGWLMATSQLAGVVVALPASVISNRLGRRNVMAFGMALAAAAILTFLPGRVWLLFVGAALLGAGSQIVYAVQVPYIAEHTEPGQRNEYFAFLFGLGTLTAFLAGIIGGALAKSLADRFELTSASGPYQVLFVLVAIAGAIGLATMFLLSNDRETVAAMHAERVSTPGGVGRFGLHIGNRALFFRLLLPGFLTSLGAGQLIPFLNVFVEKKFDLELVSINAILGITSLGTTLAILIQPALARRFGRIGSIVLVQGSSIPFLAVLGFSPVLWSVIMAMAVRNSLMNAGSPIFDAFAMDQVSPAERATLSALMSMLWSLGWVVAPIYYSVLQDRLGFTAGYAVDFVTIIVLYTTATSLLWTWFRGTDKVRPPAAAEADKTAAEGLAVATLERA